MAVKSRPFSYLNPNAPLFVPAAFMQAEDFSPEWWLLVHTCPAFRDYWLRDRYDCCSDEEELTAEDIEELDSVDDFMELQADLAELEVAEEAFRFGTESNSTSLTDSDDSDDQFWREGGGLTIEIYLFHESSSNQFPINEGFSFIERIGIATLDSFPWIIMEKRSRRGFVRYCSPYVRQQAWLDGLVTKALKAELV